jgi:carbonic anhydrase/acetyltransferase-like protein (isoleucine patch superfamily)
MNERQYDVGRYPELIADEAWIAPTATVVGRVEVGARASIWWGAVIRGDVEPIQIGEDTNIQDLACLHSDPGFPCRLGARVTVGHRALLHGATIEDETLIGMGAIVLNGARIGQHSLVGAGALVTEGKVIPPRSLAVGMPARVIRELTDEEVEKLRLSAQHYVLAASKYRQQYPAE